MRRISAVQGARESLTATHSEEPPQRYILVVELTFLSPYQKFERMRRTPREQSAPRFAKGTCSSGQSTQRLPWGEKVSPAHGTQRSPSPSGWKPSPQRSADVRAATASPGGPSSRYGSGGGSFTRTERTRTEYTVDGSRFFTRAHRSLVNRDVQYLRGGERRGGAPS